MARSVRKLIRNSFLLAQIITPSETLSGPDTAEALDLLHELLDSYAGTGLYIPYRKKLEFTLSNGKDTYTFGPDDTYDINTSKIISIDYFNVERNGVHYPLTPIMQRRFHQSYYTDQITSIPVYYYMQNDELSTSVTIYPPPSFEYTAHMWVKQRLSTPGLEETLTDVPPFYIRWLRYDLARELSNLYPAALWNQKMELMWAELREQMMSSVDQDMTVNDKAVRDQPTLFYISTKSNG